MAFHDVRLPDEIEQGAAGGPTFATNVVSISSGAEQRNSLWDRTRMKWDVGYGIKDKADYAEILDFFYARNGKAHYFLFKDWSDFEAVDQEFGVGDDIKRVFRLRKNYTSGGETYERPITHPVAASVVVKKNGITVDPLDYEFGTRGIIRFASGEQPAEDDVLTWSGQFDVPVRFDTDDFQITLYALAAGELGPSGLPIIEVREQLNTPPTEIEIITESYGAGIAENTVTSPRLTILTFSIVDDEYGHDNISIVGDDPLFFEVELDANNRTGTLYLKAGTVLNYEQKTEYNITLQTWDERVGTIPAATLDYTLDVINVAEPPIVTLSSEIHSVPVGFSTATATVIATISATADMGQSIILSLTGADAADFEIVANNLRLKSGVSTAVAMPKQVNIVATPSVAAATTVAFPFSIGVVPGTETFTVTDTFIVPQYVTMRIRVWAPGNGAWGFNVGGPTSPTPAGETYVQNDQGLPSDEVWRVQPFIMPDNTDAYTPATLAVTAKQNSYGIGPALDVSTAGIPGGAGLDYKDRDATFDALSGAGGSNLDAAGNVKLGGAAAHVATVATNGVVVVAHGADATNDGTGGSGGVFKQYKVSPPPGGLGASIPDVLKCAFVAGGGSGFYAEYEFTAGTPGSGVGDNYIAPAPAPGDVLEINIGPGGIAGLGTANGGDGKSGFAVIEWDD